jgi:hypothetical protein
MRKSRISVLAVVVTAMAFAFGVVQSAWADASSIVSTINNWAHGGTADNFSAVKNDDGTVTVSGNIENATNQLMINDTAGVTIKWKGNVTGAYSPKDPEKPDLAFGGLINLASGSGTLEISADISNDGKTVIQSIGAWNVTVKSGGKVRITGTGSDYYDSDAIHIFNNYGTTTAGGTMKVENGGIVSNPYGTAINIHEYCSIDSSTFSTDGITGFVSDDDTNSSTSTMWVYGNVENDLVYEDEDDEADDDDVSYLIVEDKATLRLVGIGGKIPPTVIAEVKPGGTLIFDENASWILKGKLTNNSGGKVIIAKETKLTLDPDPGEIDNYGTVEINGTLQNEYRYVNRPGAATVVAEGGHFYYTADAETVNDGAWNGKEAEPLNPSSSGGGCTTGLGFGLLPLILSGLVLSGKKRG